MTTREECLVDRPSFPCLCLARDTSIIAVESPDKLCRCSALAFFKSRYYEDLIVFDSSAVEYRVATAALAEPLTGMKKWFVRAFNARLTVQLCFRREAAASLDAAKDRVLAWLRKDPDFWEAGREMSEWESMVKTAPDMGRLITLFA